ncbi:MAG: chemotaxis protein CheB [Sphingobacteriales bacterium]|nr:MAG: chemotaxis protein CheB [Sphingobacteriales bacterium]
MEDKDFLVVGIGTSAGGLDALRSFFSNIPADSRSAYIVVMHLLRSYESRLDELLQKQASLPVKRVDEDMAIEPGIVYVMPENVYMTIESDILKPRLREKAINNKAVDIFFDSLAKEFKQRAIAIVLSGVGSDGLKGVEKIEEAGGCVFAQDPDSTDFDGMPMSVIKFDKPKLIATPELLAKAVVDYEQAFRSV